jgi:hypothetical protein
VQLFSRNLFAQMTFLQERISKGMLDIVDLFAMDVVCFLLQEADVKMREHP